MVYTPVAKKARLETKEWRAGYVPLKHAQQAILPQPVTNIGAYKGISRTPPVAMSVDWNLRHHLQSQNPMLLPPGLTKTPYVFPQMPPGPQPPAVQLYNNGHSLVPIQTIGNVSVHPIQPPPPPPPLWEMPTNKHKSRPKQKRKRAVEPIMKTQSYLKGNCRGALADYFGTRGLFHVKLEVDTAVNEEGQFNSTIVAVGFSMEVGQGHAWSKRLSVQYAALDLVHKLKLTEESFSTMFMRGNVLKGSKWYKPIYKTMDYLKGNFVEVLEKYYKAHGRGLKLKYCSEAQSISKTSWEMEETVEISGSSHILPDSQTKEIETTCSAIGEGVTGCFEGIGYGLTEKESKENAALDMILKLGLVTEEQHSKQEAKHKIWLENEAAKKKLGISSEGKAKMVSCQPVNPLLNKPQDLHSTVSPFLQVIAEPTDLNHDARQKSGINLKKSGLGAEKTTTSIDQISYDPDRGVMVYSNQQSIFLDISTPSSAALYPDIVKLMSDKITKRSVAKPNVADSKHWTQETRSGPSIPEVVDIIQSSRSTRLCAEMNPAEAQGHITQPFSSSKQKSTGSIAEVLHQIRSSSSSPECPESAIVKGGIALRYNKQPMLYLETCKGKATFHPDGESLGSQ